MSRYGDLLHEKCGNVFSTCVNFGCCYGNQGWADVVEKIFVLQNSSIKFSESFKSVLQGVLEIFEEVYLGGGGHNVSPPPWLDRVNLRAFSISIPQRTEHCPMPAP